MAKCFKCKREIHNGNEDIKKVVVYKYPDGTEDWSSKTEGKVAKPGGKIKAMAHFKCFKVMQKVARRTADDGSLIGDMPTAYQIGGLIMNADEAKDRGLSPEDAAASNTRELSDRAEATLHAHLRQNAERNAMRDAAVRQGLDPDRMEARVNAAVDAAVADQQAKLADRAQDPGYEEPKEKKWPAGGQIDMEI